MSDALDLTPANVPELTVSELSAAIRRTVEDAFGYVRLRGEVSGYRGAHASGHCYFALKDDTARIDAVIWRSTFQRLRIRPEEGMEVIATGRVSTYPGRSTYQIVIDRIEPAGVGALMALIEERRRKLAAEGLFDEALKKPLPYLPRLVGIVTSPTGAVIRDILHRLADRFPTGVLVWPVRVQGETSGAEVAAAIAGFNALRPDGPVPRPDLIIVARGGGSLEDLWGFNDEAVVRAAAASAIPLISAVGHETDWTLIDHAADRRAPTPTAAAEFAVPVRADLLAAVAETGARGLRALRRRLEGQRLALAHAVRGLPRREALLAGQRQTLDRLADALGRWRASGLRYRRERLAALAPRITLRPLTRRIASERRRVEELGRRAVLGLSRQAIDGRRRFGQAGPRLARAFGAGVRARRSRLDALAKLAASLGHKAVLARGFALVRDRDGRLVRGVAAARAAERLDVTFDDGTVRVAVEDDAAQPARRPERRRRVGPAGQGSLF